MKISLGPSKRGIALMVVLIAVFVLSMLAGAFAYSMKVETKLAANSNNQSDLEWLGRSGVEFARWLLAQEMSCPYDSLNQKWAGGPGGVCESNNIALTDITSLCNLKCGNGTFCLHITDLESKVNVNTADTAVLQQALSQAIGADATDIPIISDSIQDWVDRDDMPRPSGAESDYYQGLSPPYMAKNGPIDDLSELLLIKGIRDNPAIYSKKYDPMPGQVDRFGDPLPAKYAAHMDEIFTPISTGRININTASAAVLQTIPGIDANIAQEIIRVRTGPDGQNDTPFMSVAEMATVVPNVGAAGMFNRYCTVRSSTFEVQVDAQIGSSKQTFYAILARNNPRDIQILSFYWK